MRNDDAEPHPRGAARSPAAPPAAPLDPLIGELHRERRHRQVIVVAAVIGIVSGIAIGMGFVLGAFGDAANAPIGARNPALAVFFLGPPLVCTALGYAIFALLRRWR